LDEKKTFFLEKNDSSVVKLENLGMGDYEFELTATDNLGLSGTDIVSIKVIEPRDEIILTNLTWMCPMGCSMEYVIKIPSGKTFALFVRDITTNSWVAVLPVSQYSPGNDFYWERIGDFLYLYSDEIRISELKIVF